MWFEYRPKAKLPWLARWRETDGKKVSRSFPDKKARATFAVGWVRQREKFGAVAQIVEARTVATWTEFRALVGDVHPLTVAREWLQWRGTAANLKIEEAWKEFADVQEGRKLSGDAHSHRRLHGKRLLAWFPGKLVASITSEQLDGWLAQLVNVDTAEPLSPKTKLHHLKTARHFFEWLKDRRKLAHNPADAVTVPDASVIDKETGEPIHREINIVTVEQARHFFAVNRDALCVGRLALEAFAGLRYTSAARLKRGDIVWDEKGVVMPGHLHKSTNRHYVDGWPDNLWAWMKHAPSACWDIRKRQYADLKREAFERAGMKADAEAEEAMRNVWRHSFATYHLAAHKDAKLTAYLMTKTSVQSVNNDYRGRASKAQGEAYFAIVPQEKPAAE